MSFPVGKLRWLALAFLTPTAVLAADNLVPYTDAVAIAAGGGHACAIEAGGGVKCWGRNDFGQLGNGSTTNSYVPVRVQGLDGPVVDLGVGRDHSCAVTEAGAVRCWGRNTLGQLGDGSTKNRMTPVDVVGLDSGVEAVRAGSAHSCALDDGGGLRCWGFNGDGQLGVGDRDNRLAPALVQSTGVSAIAVGQSNACLLATTGAVRCWGVYDRTCNSFGCAFASFSSPSTVSGVSGAVDLDTDGYFQCVVTSTGAVRCWGDNYSGQLGNPDEPDPDPFQIFDIQGVESGIVEVSLGAGHGCARREDGTVACWGSNSGQVGNGTTDYTYPAENAIGLGDALQVSAGGAFTCAISAGSGVRCWGSNSSGQLGNNDPWFRYIPTAVPGLESGVQAIAVGEFHGCALTQDGAVKCWGGNSSGQVGNGNTIGQPVPVDVSGLGSGVVIIGAGYRHTCAATTGAAFCWGDNFYGQLGNGGFEDQNVPTAVELTERVVNIEGGERHTCAAVASGGVRCWGWGIDGELGNGDRSTTATPVSTFGLNTGARQVTTGGVHSCAIRTSRDVACWGQNSDGQLGDGTTDDRYIATDTDSLSGATFLSAGRSHTCAVVGGGEAFCWGEAASGKLGAVGAFGAEETPLRVNGLFSGVTDISAGFEHSCAVVDGAARCWGSNRFGQLGTGDTDNASTPMPVSGLGSGVKQVAAGDLHSCALTDGGRVLCWGSNTSDQLGLGRLNFRVPGAVLNDPSLFRSGFEAAEIGLP